MNISQSVGAFVLGSLLSTTVLAEAAAGEQSARGWPGAVGVSLDASVLLGIGLSVGVPLGDRYNLRLSHHAYSYDKEFEDGDSGATYDGTLDLKSTGLLADWHPFKGVFRLTAGLMANGNKIKLVGTDGGTGEYDVGDCTYQSDPSDPLRVDGVTDFKSTAPYLGLGWGGNMNAGPGFYGIFDIGVMFSGSPDTGLKGSGSARAKAGQGGACGDEVNYQDVSGYPEFQNEVQNAENDANEESKDFKLWPNIAFGIGWRF